MTYSTNTPAALNTPAAYKPALLPTPATAGVTAPVAGSQLDPLAVAAAAALLLARLVYVLGICYFIISLI